MLYKLAYDPSDGSLLGFYPMENAEAENYIAVDEDTKLLYTGELDAYKVNPDTQDIVPKSQEELSTVRLRNIRVQAIAAKCDAFINGLRAEYSAAEIDSWTKQESGAKDILAGTESDDAGFVKAMAQARGISAEDLANRIIANVKSADAVVSVALGHMQKLQDTLNAVDLIAEDAREKILAVDWPANAAEYFAAGGASEMGE